MRMKRLLTFLTLLTLSIGVSWATKVTITYNSTFDPALPTASGSVNSSATAHTVEGLSIKEAGIYKGATATYIMFAQNKGYLYNTESLGTINSVAVTYSSSCSTSAKVGVYFGNSEQSTYTVTSNTTISGQSKTDTWTNTTSGYGYFQLSTSNKNTQITKIEIDYTPSGSTQQCAAPTFSPEADGNTLYESLDVTISSTTPNATIRYTIGDTEPNDPTTTTGTLYTGPITVSSTKTIKAIAFAENYDPSDVVTATYIFGEPASNGLATFNATVDKGNGTITKTPVTFSSDNSSVLNNGTEYRLYKNSETTFSVEDGYTITKIEFTCTAEGTEKYGPGCFTPQTGYSYEGNIGTWEGESQSVSFIASEYQVRATLIKVYFVESSSITVGVPSISFDEWTSGDITVDATITPGTNATATLYKIGEDGTYATYTDPIEIDLTEEASPITVYAKSTNGNNESSEVHETFTLPALAVSINPSSYSGTEAQSVEISATNVVGRAALTYKINDGTVENYSDAISLSTPGTYTITAYASDDRADGEQVSATATITINEQQAGTLTATFVAGTDKGSTTSNGTPDEMSKGNPLVTVYGSDAAFATDEYRLYQGSETTISVPAGSKITKIVFTCTASGTAKYGPGNLTTESGYTYSGYVGTWEGEAQSVTFGAPSKQVRCTTIDVTYIAGETQETADYYLVGTFNMDGNNWVQIDPLYKFEDNHDGTYSLNGKDMPDNVQFKIIKVVDNNITWYGGSVGDGNPYGLHGGWHTNIPLKDTPDYNQSIQNFKMEVGGESNFTIHASTTPMTLDVEKTKLYLRKSTDNWANHEMTPVNGGGWTLAEESFDADAQFHIVDGWNVQRGTSQTEGDNLYWIYQSATDIQCGLDQNKPNFKIVTAGDYTLTVNSALTQLTVHCILPTYEARIASDINGGTVAFNSSGSTTPLELTENSEVRVYVTPQTADWELATLTYTVTDGSPVSFIENYNNVGNYYFFSMPAANVEINATFTWQGGEVTETTYALVTSDSDIEVGAKYIIVNEEYSKAFVKAYQSQGVDIDNHTTTITNALGIAEFVLGNGSTQGTYTFKCGDVYLYNSSSTSLDITGTSSTDNNWTISIGGAEDYFATITSSNNRIIYYFASGPDFRAYSKNNYSSNVKLYKEVSAPVEATLAEVIALGENADGKKYKIKDEDGLLGVYKNGTSVWFKDEEQAVDYQNPTAASYEYYTVVEQNLGINKSEKDFAQNNWIEVVFPSEQDFANAYVRNLTGTYSCENGNPKLTLTVAVDEENDVTKVQSSGLAYELNPYMAVNFAGNQTYTNNGETKTFFFSQPKAQEYAQILWAVWNGTEFIMPTGEDNYYGFTGSFTINPELNEYDLSGLKTNSSYNFKAIIRKSASKAGPYEVYPTDLNPDVPTAINGVVVNGNVKSVKYVNVAGIVSDVPFQGVNIVVTEYTDGSRTTTKMLKK